MGESERKDQFQQDKDRYALIAGRKHVKSGDGGRQGDSEDGNEIEYIIKGIDEIKAEGKKYASS